MGDEEVKSDVQEMNKSFGYELSTESEEEETTKEEDTANEEEVNKQEDPELDGAAEEILEDLEGETEEEDEPEEDEKDKVINDLKRRLEKLEKEKSSEPNPEPDPDPKPAEETLEFVTQEFIGEDEDLEDLISEPGKLNKVFNKVYQQAVTDTRKTLGEGVLRAIPEIVRANVSAISELQKSSDKFYEENEDLKPFKKVVAAVFEEIASDNPGKSYNELLPDVADEARKRLDLHKKATSTSTRKSPKLPRRKQRTVIPEDKPNTNPLLNELEEMNKTLRR